MLTTLTIRNIQVSCMRLNYHDLTPAPSRGSETIGANFESTLVYQADCNISVMPNAFWGLEPGMPSTIESDSRYLQDMCICRISVGECITFNFASTAGTFLHITLFAIRTIPRRVSVHSDVEYHLVT